MDYFFGFIFDAAIAYFQIIMILIGAVIFLFGGSAFLALIQKQKKSRRWINAIIVGLREGEGMADSDGARGKFYYPIFEADDGSGHRARYECKIGSSNINKFQVGKRARISLLENSPGFAETEDASKVEFMIGIMLCLIGGALVTCGVLFVKLTVLTYIVWAITAAFLLFKFGKSIKPKHLWETVEQFKARRSREEVAVFQEKPIVSSEYIQAQNKKFEYVGGVMSKISIFAGFVIMVVGCLGYNSQLKFIDNARLEVASPCTGLALGEDCKRTVLLQDAWSLFPVALRPRMEGVYISNTDPSRVIVNYGEQTPALYFAIIAFGALVVYQTSRRTKKV